MLNTIFCKRTALPLGLLSLALVLPSCGSSEYKKYADNQAKQVASILRENGCMQCHSATAATPFYGNLPLIGPTVKADMREGTRYLDLTAMLERSTMANSFPKPTWPRWKMPLSQVPCLPPSIRTCRCTGGQTSIATKRRSCFPGRRMSVRRTIRHLPSPKNLPMSLCNR